MDLSSRVSLVAIGLSLLFRMVSSSKGRFLPAPQTCVEPPMAMVLGASIAAIILLGILLCLVRCCIKYGCCKKSERTMLITTVEWNEKETLNTDRTDDSPV